MRNIIALLIVSGLVLFSLFLVRSFKIVSLDCVSQFTKCNSDVLASLDRVEKDGMFLTRTNINKVLMNNPLIKKYSIQLKLNGKYIIYVEERIPRYCVKSSDSAYLSDSEGLIIKIGDSGSIRCIEKSDSDYELGDKLKDNDFFIQKILYNIRNIDGIDDSYVTDSNLIVEYKGNIKLIFPSEGDADTLAGKAYYTISQFDKIEEYIIEIGKISVSEVDFRFNDPVIKFI